MLSIRFILIENVNFSEMINGYYRCIVAEGWVGAHDPHSHPLTPQLGPLHPQTRRPQLQHRFRTWPTDKLTDQRTDKASFRVACPQVKSDEKQTTMHAQWRILPWETLNHFSWTHYHVISGSVEIIFHVMSIFGWNIMDERTKPKKETRRHI